MRQANKLVVPSDTKLGAMLSGARQWPPPVWLMRQAGRYLPEYRAVRQEAGSFLDLCLTPKLATEVTLQPVRRFDLDAAILFADILLIPWALGQELSFVDGEGPALMPPIGPDTIGTLRADGVGMRLGPICETVRKVRQELPGDVALIGFCGAPWTVATYMVAGGPSAEHLDARLWAYQDVGGFASLIDLLVHVSTDYLVGQVEAGADCVMIFDSWAGLLPEIGFERWVVEPTMRLVEGVRERVPGVPIIGFPRGAGLRYGRYVEATGVDGVGLDQTVPLQFARDVLQTKAAVQGNVDPVALLAGGAVLEDAVRSVVGMLGSGPLICNLGHGIHKDTPVDHVADFVRLVRSVDPI